MLYRPALTPTPHRENDEVAIEYLCFVATHSYPRRRLHLHSGSQQSPELSCQPPLSASLCTTAPSSRPMPANGDWDFGRTATNIPHVAWSNQWLEWTVGLGRQLSVEALDER